MVTGAEGVSPVKIEAVRKARNMSQEELAAKTFTSQTSICKIEKGIQAPSVAVLIRMAKALDVNIEQLCQT